MANDKDKKKDKKKPNDTMKANAMDHFVIRDKQTNKDIINKRG